MKLSKLVSFAITYKYNTYIVRYCSLATGFCMPKGPAAIAAESQQVLLAKLSNL